LPFRVRPSGRNKLCVCVCVCRVSFLTTVAFQVCSDVRDGAPAATDRLYDYTIFKPAVNHVSNLVMDRNGEICRHDETVGGSLWLAHGEPNDAKTASMAATWIRRTARAPAPQLCIVSMWEWRPQRCREVALYGARNGRHGLCFETLF
jgi:hypothetical protein